MELDYCFHGTSFDNAKKILKTKNVYTNINPISNKVINKVFEKNKNGKIYISGMEGVKRNIGSIGLGFYAFHYNENNAILFAKKMKRQRKYTGNSSVLIFKIKNGFEQNILDFTDHKINEMYHLFLENYQDVAEFIKKNYKFTNNTAAKKLDGIMIEGFIRAIQMEHNTEILAAYSFTLNEIGVNLEKTTMLNSYELSIRNNKIIDYDTISLKEIREEGWFLWNWIFL